MSASKPDSQKPSGPLTVRYRKILWGIRQDQAKLHKLSELTIAHIRQALELADGEKERLEKQGETAAAEWTEKEIRCLQRDEKTLKHMIEEIEACRKSWPALDRKKIRKPGTKAPPKKHPTILVIDDDKITAKSLEHFLRQKKYEVIAVPNAEDGLNKALTIKPDLILLDIMMPGMNGYQFLTLLRQDRVTTDIPVIVLSSLARESDILEGLEKGAVDYIVKPYSPSVLLSKVTKILSAKDEHISHNRRL
jgi:CheY-like chemotaxis protein